MRDSTPGRVPSIVARPSGGTIRMSSAETPVLLDVRQVDKRFGGLTAVKDLSLRVSRGSLFGLIGPNGAGKTTVFNLLTGVYRPTDGEIHFDGRRVDGQRP